MQTLFLTGNLAADCEVVKGKDEAEFIRFTVASNEPGADREEKPTYYNCRMRKTGVAERLKKRPLRGAGRQSPYLGEHQGRQVLRESRRLGTESGRAGACRRRVNHQTLLCRPHHSRW